MLKTVKKVTVLVVVTALLLWVMPASAQASALITKEQARSLQKEAFEPTWEVQVVPSSVVGADNNLLDLFKGNEVIQDAYTYALKDFDESFREKIVWLSNEPVLKKFLLDENKTGKNSKLLNVYSKNEAVQNAILLEYDKIEKWMYPLLQYQSFCNTAEKQDKIEMCLRYIYSINPYVQGMLENGELTQRQFEAALAKLIDKEKEFSYLSILYVYEDGLYVGQDIEGAAFNDYVTHRAFDAMYQLELLLSYDTAITLPEPLAYRNA